MPAGGAPARVESDRAGAAASLAYALGLARMSASHIDLQQHQGSLRVGPVLRGREAIEQADIVTCVG
jgi:hypothetical protein